MRQIRCIAVAVAALCGLSAVAQDGKPAQEDKPKPQPEADSAFMIETARANLKEIAIGQLAATQSMNVDVKAFGDRMVTEHKKLNTDLAKVATKKNVKLPDKLTDDEQKSVDEMGKLTGPAFDKRFTQAMVTGHQAAVESFKKASAGAQDAEVKAFAAAALPNLELHLKEAKELRDKIGGTPEKPTPDKPKPREPEQPRPLPPPDDKPDRPRPDKPNRPDGR